MNYFCESKKRCLILQLSGCSLSLFLLFIRFSDYAKVDASGTSTEEIFNGKWSNGLNAIYNGIASYLFIGSVICTFLPVFLGKLSIIRDIYASPFFRPISKINYSASVIEGLFIIIVFYS